MLLVLVQPPSTNQSKEIYNFTSVGMMRIIVESQRTRASVLYCHRYQSFAHNQARCRQTPRCVKCGETQQTSECTKMRNINAKWAYCGGRHPANYRGCRSFPQTKGNIKGDHKPTTTGSPLPSVNEERAMKRPSRKYKKKRG